MIYAIDSWVLTKSKLSEHVRRTWLTDSEKLRERKREREREREGYEVRKREATIGSLRALAMFVKLSVCFSSFGVSCETCENALEGVWHLAFFIVRLRKRTTVDHLTHQQQQHHHHHQHHYCCLLALQQLFKLFLVQLEWNFAQKCHKANGLFCGDLWKCSNRKTVCPSLEICDAIYFKPQQSKRPNVHRWSQ